MKDERVQLSVSLPRQLVQRIRQLAEVQRRSPSMQVQLMLEQALRPHTKGAGKPQLVATQELPFDEPAAS